MAKSLEAQKRIPADHSLQIDILVSALVYFIDLNIK